MPPLLYPSATIVHLSFSWFQIHKAVVTVQRCVNKLQGCIHRFTVDDKGCVMKVVFGAHMPHEDQPYRALLAALQLRQALSLQGIQPALGVASGESLIGPVGGNTRQVSQESNALFRMCICFFACVH